MTNKFLIAALISVLALSHAVFGGEEADPNQDYCAMVAEYQSSDGEFGWPDYEDKFDRVCVGDE